MERDFDTFNKWMEWSKNLALEAFNKDKEKAIKEANEIPDESNRKGMLRAAMAMKFMFEKSNCLHYGNCTKFSKPVCFIPNVCQIETQNCFEHRKASHEG